MSGIKEVILPNRFDLGEVRHIVDYHANAPEIVINCFRIRDGREVIEVVIPANAVTEEEKFRAVRIIGASDSIVIQNTTPTEPKTDQEIKVITVRHPDPTEAAQILRAQIERADANVTCRSGNRSVGRIPHADAARERIKETLGLLYDIVSADKVAVRRFIKPDSLTEQPNHDRKVRMTAEGAISTPREVAARATYRQNLQAVAEDNNREVPPDPILTVKLPLPPDPNGLLLPYPVSSQILFFIPHATTAFVTSIELNSQAVIIQAAMLNGVRIESANIRPTHRFTFDIENNEVLAERLDGKYDEEFEIFGGPVHPLYVSTLDSLTTFPQEAYKRTPALLDLQPR